MQKTEEWRHLDVNFVKLYIYILKNFGMVLTIAGNCYLHHGNIKINEIYEFYLFQKQLGTPLCFNIDFTLPQLR